ncbi:MFS transporter [Alteromonadaceae bacterium BrNp21-10]|nr:MFS transporter [Alteromonadaceae bacterium BrNp21-10]
MLKSYFDLFRQYWPMLGFGVLGVFLGNFGQSFFVSWYGDVIQRDLGLSATAYGTAYSSATLVSGLGIMILGGLIDKISTRHFLIFAGVGLACSGVLMWHANNIYWLTLAFFVLRFFGQGLLPHTSATAVSRYFSKNRGKALSTASFAVPLGEIILPLLAVFLIAWVGWQQSWLVISAMVLVLGLPAALWLLKQAGPAEAENITDSLKPLNAYPGSRRTLLKDRRFWLVLPLVLMPPFIVTGIFIHQGFILQQKHWSPSLFAMSFTLYGVVHWIASLIGGALVDKYSSTAVLKFIGAPFAMALVVSGLFDGDWIVLVLMGLMGAGIGFFVVVPSALWAEIYGTANIGSIRSLVVSLSILSTSVSPVLLGYFIDAQISGNHLLLALGIYAAVCSVLSWFSYSSPKQQGSI